MIKFPSPHIKLSMQHPLFGISPVLWSRLLIENHGFDLRYIQKVFFVTLLSFATTPFRCMFFLNYTKKIKQHVIPKPPIFIIGHWRSGTTFLHELLSYDPQFCHISLWNTMLPHSFPILEPFKYGLGAYLPSKRPMDNIDVAVDGPYEEEAGLAVIEPYSFFHGLHFPKNAENQYKWSIHFEGLSKKDIQRWKQHYLSFLKTVSYMNPTKQLLLKNPANTARIPTLLELFPNAKFIHIYRNPYKVFMSTMKMRHRVLEALALQHSDSKEIKQQVISNYIRLMRTFFSQQHLIPKNQYYEIKYETLVHQPLKEVESLYQKLDINGFQKAKPYLQQYLDQKKGYKTNVYSIDDDIVKMVRNNWDFTLKKWNYSLPDK